MTGWTRRRRSPRTKTTRQQRAGVDPTLFDGVSPAPAGDGACAWIDEAEAERAGFGGLLTRHDLTSAGYARVAAAVSSGDATLLSRETLIDYVQALNPTAGPGYLAAFETATLLAYLERLLRQNEPRSAGSTWVRLGGSPAITLCGEDA